ncbi:MAG: hypothetical protein M3133_09605 [Actinomycetota bacterium]|nr:hypothetical protein [Actinomycetota bacterium]
MTGWAALVLGAASVAAVVGRSDPLSTGPRMVGTVLLAVSTLAAAVAARRRHPSAWTLLASLGADGHSLHRYLHSLSVLISLAPAMTR